MAVVVAMAIAAIALAGCGGTIEKFGEADGAGDTATDWTADTILDTVEDGDALDDPGADAPPDAIPDPIADTPGDPAGDPHPDLVPDPAFDTVHDIPPDPVTDHPVDTVIDPDPPPGNAGDPCAIIEDCAGVTSDTHFCMFEMWGFITFTGGYCSGFCGSDAECGPDGGCDVGQCFRRCTSDVECRTWDGYVCHSIPFISADTYCLPPG